MICPIVTEVAIPYLVETAINPESPYVTTTPSIVMSAPPLDNVVPSITAPPSNSITLRGVERIVVVKADGDARTRPDGPKLMISPLIVVPAPPCEIVPPLIMADDPPGRWIIVADASPKVVVRICPS